MSTRKGLLDEASVEELKAEVLSLRARIDELARVAPAEAEPRRSTAPPRVATPPVPSRRDTLEVLRPALIHWNTQGKVLQWDRRAEQLFAIPAREAIGKSLMTLVASFDVPPDQLRGWIQLMLTDKMMSKIRTVHETRDGRTMICEWANSVAVDADGNPKEIVSVVQDVGLDLGKSPMVRDSQQILLGLVDNLPSLVTVKDRKGRTLLANPQVEAILKVPREKIIGMTASDLFPPEVAEEVRRKDQEAIAAGRAVEVEEITMTPSGPRTYLTVRFPLYDTQGGLIGLCAVATDITHHKRADAERAALQEQVIAAQQDALRELSTPLLPVADGILVLPLLGTIDSGRAGQILEALLDGISKQRAHTAIIDITGVRVVDAEVAAALVRSARAARLLGAKVVLTGVSPDVARTLVELGAELSGIVTLGTLQSGIAFALGRRTAGS